MQTKQTKEEAYAQEKTMRFQAAADVAFEQQARRELEAMLAQRRQQAAVAAEDHTAKRRRDDDCALAIVRFEAHARRALEQSFPAIRAARQAERERERDAR